MKYEFTFEFNNSDPLYLTHDSDVLDNELLQFMIEIDVDFKNITNFKIDKL